MRIRLILQDHAGIYKRKLWFLLDASKCAKVADVSYLIKKQFFTCDERRVSLSLDGFELPAQEKVDIIRDGDTITVQIHENTIRKSSSSSETEDTANNKFTSKKIQSNKNLDKVPVVKRTIITKKSLSRVNPSNVLKKVVATLPYKNVLNKVKLNNKSAANVLMKDGTANPVSTDHNHSSRKLVTAKSNCLVKSHNTQKKNVCESSSSSSSSSSSDDQTEYKRKAVIAKKKVIPAKKIESKKTLPLSKLSISKKVSSSESSTEDDQPSKKKKVETSDKNVSVLLSSNKKVTLPKKKDDPEDSGDSVDSSSSSDEEVSVKTKSPLKNRTELKNNEKSGTGELKTKNYVKVVKVPDNKQLTNKQSRKSSEDSTDSSSSSSDTSKTKQKNAKVDFKVSNQLKNRNSTNAKDITGKKSVIHTANLNNSLHSKAKIQISKDVYKNKSQFLVSKSYSTSTPSTANDAHNTLNDGILSSLDKDKQCFVDSPSSTLENGRLHVENVNTQEISNGNDLKENLNDSFTPRKECVSGKTLRRRRRNQNLRERKNKGNMAKVNKVEIPGSSVTVNGDENGIDMPITNINIVNKVEIPRSSVTVNGDENGIDMPLTNIEGTNNDSVADDKVYTGVPSLNPPKDYSSCEKLTEPPDIGSIISYKILEMCTDTYTPAVSNNKEAYVKSYDKETSTLELELKKDSQVKKDNDKLGKFEMPDVSDIGNQEDVQERSIFVNWVELIEPCLVI